MRHFIIKKSFFVAIALFIFSFLLVYFYHNAQNLQKGMQWIPGDTFLMGSNDDNSIPNERPAHQVKVDGFWIDEHPITNAEFQKFVKATGYITTAEKKPEWEELKKQLPPGTPKPADSLLVPGSLVFIAPPEAVPLNNLAGWWRWMPGANWKHPEGPGSNLKGRENHPAVQISWEDATAYATWKGKRLPTEAEWEYAARGGLAGKRYPWGDEFKPNGKYMANTFQGKFPYDNIAEDGYLGTSPVKSFPANGYGLYDMAGNVWEWTQDWYDSRGRYVIKGGSFLCHVDYCESYRPSARRGQTPDTGTSHIGFRLVMSKKTP